MLYWDGALDHDVEDPRVDRFMADIEAVCRKHGLSISHEDCGVGFFVEEFDEDSIFWLASNLDLEKL